MYDVFNSFNPIYRVFKPRFEVLYLVLTWFLKSETGVLSLFSGFKGFFYPDIAGFDPVFKVFYLDIEGFQGLVSGNRGFLIRILWIVGGAAGDEYEK